MNYRKRLVTPLLITAVSVLSYNPAYAQLAIHKVSDADFYPSAPAKEALGKLLMFDKILSGNQNIACASCHHPLTGTSDGLSLPVGEGGTGLSVMRSTGAGADAIIERVPRNSPALFNLGAREYSIMFHDGRLAVDETQPGGFLSPAGDQLPEGLDNVLAAQAMFPVTSGTEMAGQAHENPVATAAAANHLAGPDGVWALLADRLRANDEYVNLFKAAYPDEINSAADINFVHVANAIGAYEAAAFRCTNSPFDRFVNSGGDPGVVSAAVLRGGTLFYNIGCADCHSGKFQTDHRFYALGVPQIGPGKGDGDGHDDFGRERVTGDSSNRYQFRTPSLRQVSQTGPWGHSGAYSNLEDMVRHHFNALEALQNYDLSQATLPTRSDLDAIDGLSHANNTQRQALADAAELMPQAALSDADMADLMTFLTEGLSDPACIDMRHEIPTRVPSGLSIAD